MGQRSGEYLAAMRSIWVVSNMAVIILVNAKQQAETPAESSSIKHVSRQSQGNKEVGSLLNSFLYFQESRCTINVFDNKESVLGIVTIRQEHMPGDC